MKKITRFSAFIAGTALLLSSACFVSCGDPEQQDIVTATKLTISNSKNYTVGDEVLASDFSVKALMSDNSTKKLTSSDFTVTVPENNLSDGKLCRSEGSEGHNEKISVTVKYDSVTGKYNITVYDQIKKLAADYSDFVTEYNIGDTPDYSKIKVTAWYDDEGTVTEDVSSEAIVESFSTAEAGTYTVKVSYNGVESADTVEVTVKDPLDISAYYKKYFVTTDSSITKESSTYDSWGSGATAVPGDDGSVSCTSAKMWNSNEGICFALNDITAGTLAKYTYLYIKADITDFTPDGSTEEGNYGWNVKIPEVLKKIGDYKRTKGNTVTFTVPLSIYDTAVNTATQIGIIFGGSGTIKFTEVALAAPEDPESVPVTSITASSDVSAALPGDKVTFTVIDSNHNDVTSSASFEIYGEDKTVSEINSNVLTAGNSEGTVTVRASYTSGENTFTSDVSIKVQKLTNLINSTSINSTQFFNSSWGKITTCNATANGTTLTVELAEDTTAQWQSQVKINTDADLKNGASWYFSCKISGIEGNYTIKLNDDTTLANEIKGAITEEGVKVVVTGTSAADYTDLPIMFDFGNSKKGTVVVSDILLAVTSSAE